MESFILKNVEGCGQSETPNKFPSSGVGSSDSASAVLVFGGLNITADMDVKNAFLEFHTLSGNNPSVGEVIPYTIGLLYAPYTSFLTDDSCLNLTDVNHQELLIPVFWNVTTDGWSFGKNLVTVDISRLVNFLLRKSTWTRESKAQILFIPLETAVSSTWFTQINRTEIVIHYEEHSPSKSSSTSFVILWLDVFVSVKKHPILMKSGTIELQVN